MIRLLILTLLLLCSQLVKAQSYIYQYVDPCTKNLKFVSVPLNGAAVAVTYYGQVGTFTNADFSNGNFISWLNQTSGANAGKPCDQATTQAVTSTNLIVTNNIISTLTNITSVSMMASSIASNVAGASSMVGGNLGNTVNNGSAGNGSGNGGSGDDKKNNNGNGSSSNNGGNSTGSSGNNGGGNSGSGSGSGQTGGNPSSGSGGQGSSSGGSTQGGGSSSQPPVGNSGSSGGTGTGSNGNTNGGGTGSTSGTEGATETGGSTQSKASGGTANSVSNAAEGTSGSSSSSSSGGSSKSSGDKNRARTGALIGTGDIVAVKSTEPGEKEQFKFTMSMTKSNTKNTFARGFLGNFTTQINNSNITLYGAWTIPKSKLTIIGANSSMVNPARDFFNTTTLLTSKRFTKLSLMGGLNFTAGKIGETGFQNLSAVGGGFYLFNVGKQKKITGTLLVLGVYSPFTQFYEGSWWSSGLLVVPFSSWDYSITKKFKFNISFSGTYELNKNMLNYQVLTGGKVML